MKKILLLLCLSVSFIACGESNQPGVNSNKVLATVNGEKITEKDLYTKGAAKLKKIEDALFDAKEDILESIIRQKLLEAESKKQNVTVSELLKKEVHAKVSDPSPEEVNKIYEQYKDQFEGRPKEQAVFFIMQRLKADASQSIQDEYLDSLEEKFAVKNYLVKPIERVTVSMDDDHQKGPKDAPVQIIEFTDFQCPFCGRARPTVAKVIETYGDKVVYVLRDFPLDGHALAQDAAEAAQCAGVQNKYWEYSNILWQNQGALEVANLKKFAKELGLDTEKFNQCLDSDQFAQEVKKDLQDGVKAGVSGTPAFFINGRLISGARPFKDFKKIIDEELKSAKKN